MYNFDWKIHKRFLDLQMFADDPAAGAGAAPGTAEKADTAGAAADTGKEKPAGPEKKYTDDDVDRIVSQKHAEWQKKRDKEVDEAKKLAAMDARQKAEYERDKAIKELEEYKRKDSIAEMTKTARKILSDDGITVSDELLSMMVSTDAEETKAAVDGFKKAFNEAVEAAVKERLKGEPPRRGSGGGAPAMTKEQIMAIKDPELRQKKMLENRELFHI